VMSYPIADSVAQDRHRSMHLSSFFNLCAPSRYRKIYGFYNLAVADPSATRAEACSLVYRPAGERRSFLSLALSGLR